MLSKAEGDRFYTERYQNELIAYRACIYKDMCMCMVSISATESDNTTAKDLASTLNSSVAIVIW